MSTIQINKQYKLEVDTYNHTLFEFKVIKNKVTKAERKKWVTMDKHFSNVRQALIWLTQHRAGSVDHNSLELYINKLEQLWSEVK